MVVMGILPVGTLAEVFFIAGMTIAFTFLFLVRTILAAWNVKGPGRDYKGCLLSDEEKTML